MKVSLIVSTYNEIDGINEFYKVTNKYLQKLKNIKYEIIFVNDGSSDGTKETLLKIATNDKMVKIINFSRNYGHEAAMKAGLDNASGDILIFMDADLQHPPRLIEEIIEKFEKDKANIVTMVRKKNPSASIMKKITSNGFYFVINKLSEVHFEPNASDFFAIDKKVQEVLKNNYNTRSRFLRGYVQEIGFKREKIEYEAEKRFAGSSHYSFKKLLNLSFTSIILFSNIPLKLGLYLFYIMFAISLILLILFFILKTNIYLILCIMIFISSLLFLNIGVIGEYLATILNETKDKPIYIIDDKINFIEEK